MNKSELSYSLRDLYKVAQISEQAVLRHRRRIAKASIDFINLMESIDEYRSRHPGCGLEKMYYQLKVSGIGRDKFIALGKQMGYGIKRSRAATKTTLPGLYQWPNLIEGILVCDINRVWQSDITYYRLGNSFYYLTFIMDVYSRRILSYAVSRTLEAKANIEALKKAFNIRKGNKFRGLIHHSDRGSQYTSKKYVQLLYRHKAMPSMGEKGQDNAYAERVNGIIKNEYLIYRNINTSNSLIRWVNQAVRQYNHERIHNSLPGKQSPIQFEKMMLTLNYQQRPKELIHANRGHAPKPSKLWLNSLPEEITKATICPL